MLKDILKITQKNINRILSIFDLELIKRYPRQRGISVYADVKFFLGKQKMNNCIDVGANVGQTTKILRSLFPSGYITAVEPDPMSFQKLLSEFKDDDQVTCVQAFVGAEKGATTFFRNIYSDMNSGLKRGKDAWGKVETEMQMSVTTLDDLVSSIGVSHVDFLKIDTQGFDFEVLKGAEKLLSDHSVDIIAIEHIFSEMYVDLPNFDEVLYYMRKKKYELLAIYAPVYQRYRLGWTDILFASETFILKNMP